MKQELIDGLFTRAEILEYAALHATAKDKILYALKSGLKLTQGEVNRWPFCCSRLASRISELKQEGHPIEKNMIKVTCGDGHVAVVAEYYLKG